jgi:hypothetical protein
VAILALNDEYLAGYLINMDGVERFIFWPTNEGSHTLLLGVRNKALHKPRDEQVVVFQVIIAPSHVIDFGLEVLLVDLAHDDLPATPHGQKI